MASITISPVVSKFPTTSTITGEEKIFIINPNGERSTIEVNQILEKIDDNIVDRIDDDILEKLEDQIDEKIEDRLENVEPECNLKWNDVL